MVIPAVVIFFISIAISRFLSERALRTLDDDAKIRLIDGFSGKRMYSMVPLLILIGVYWCLLTQTDIGTSTATSAYLLLALIHVVLNAWINHAMLKQLDMPEDYRMQFLVAQIVSVFGVVVFLYAMMAEFVQ